MRPLPSVSFCFFFSFPFLPRIVNCARPASPLPPDRTRQPISTNHYPPFPPRLAGCLCLCLCLCLSLSLSVSVPIRPCHCSCFVPRTPPPSHSPTLVARRPSSSCRTLLHSGNRDTCKGYPVKPTYSPSATLEAEEKKTKRREKGEGKEVKK